MAGFVQLLGSKTEIATQQTCVFTLSGKTVTAGNTVVILAFRGSNADTISGVTTSGTGATGSVDIAGIGFAGDSSVGLCSLYCPNGIADGGTISVAWTAASAFNYWDLILSEYTGLLSSAWTDKTSSQATTGTTADSTSTTTTAQADELLVGGILLQSTAKTIAAGGSYNLRSSQINDTNYGASFAIEDRVVSATGTYNATFSWDAATLSYAALIATYKIAAAGRTTKNTLAAPLGMDIGMNWRGGL